MNIARIQVGSETAYGIVEDDTVVRIAGDPYGEFTRTGDRYRLQEVKLLAPSQCTVLYAAGMNYADHADWYYQWAGRRIAVPTKPEPGYRAVNALIGHQEAIVIPRDASEEVHYEGELVAVIGRRTRRVSEAEALSYVAGYTCGNDVSQRTWQESDRSLWRAKNTDTFKPVGPWMTSGLDPQNLEVITRVNGEVVQRYNTSTMVFGVATYVSYMSQYLTLFPGDMIFMGTANGTGVIRPGDVVEVEISGIGTLRNPVTRET